MKLISFFITLAGTVPASKDCDFTILRLHQTFQVATPHQAKTGWMDDLLGEEYYDDQIQMGKRSSLYFRYLLE